MTAPIRDNPAPRETASHDELLRLLRDQRGLYDQLSQLSGRQRGLISGDQPELLLGILQDRQRLVAGLARINEELAPFRRDWNAIYNALPDDVRGETADLLNQVNELLRGIIRNDEEDGRLLAARKQAVSQTLSALSDGRAANKAYARQSQSAATPKRDQHG